MKAYDFNVVFSPLEFQKFARDMVQKRENIFFESFAEGRDDGIDGRYVAEDGETTILQVKKYKNMSSRIAGIMRAEKEKIDDLVRKGKRVDRYILVISEDIGSEKKDQVLKIMFPYIMEPKDIIMREDLNNLLSMPEYQEIEKKYVQLWIPSVNILNRSLFQVVHASILEKSRICYQRMINKKVFFVETDVFRKTISKAQKNRAVIVSGEPGVGKTTLAEQVALYYLGKYRSENFIAVSSMSELYIALSIEGKKVILYDDFWGSNGLEQFKVEETSRELVNIIEQIKREKDCILIITTREYILEQGIKKNEEFRNLIAKYKLECRITQYMEADKLQIYYGHLRGAELTWKQTHALMQEKYEVIYSENYNPRVLELFVNSVETDWTPQICVERLERYLRCPEDFWKNIFAGISREARLLFVMMAITPLPIEMDILEKCYDNYMETREIVYDWKSFSDVVIELEKTVIRTDLYNERGSGYLVVTFQNPSVKDFLIYYLRINFTQYRQVLNSSCQYYAQYVEYLKLLNEIKAPIDVYGEVFERALESLETESIAFYDKHKTLLEYNDELKKYYANFRTTQDYHDVGFGRFFQLLTMYKDGCSEIAKDKIKRMFFTIMISIAHYPEITLEEDFGMIPRAITTMYETGICRQILPLLEIYMENLMRNRKSINDMEIKREFPDIWKQYVDKHQEKIAEYLEKYYDAEICIAAAEGKIDEYWWKVTLCEEGYEEYHMNIPETLKSKMEIYASWVEDDEEIWSDEEIKDERAVLQKSISEIEDEFEDDFLRVIYPETIENVEEWLQEREVLPEVKEEIELVEKRGHIIWNEFLQDEDSMKFLEQYIQYAGKFSEDIVETIRKINQYLTEKCGLGQEELQKTEICLNSEKYVNDYAWSQKQMEDVLEDMMIDNEKFLEEMVEAKVLVHHQHWYRWLNKCLSECIRLNTEIVDEEKRITYYQSIKKDLMNEKSIYEDRFLWEILYRADKEKYEKYILIPAASIIYKNIFEKKEGWLNNLIQYLKFQYIFEDNEIIGGEFSGDIRTEIVEIYLEIDLFDNIWDAFSEENMARLKQLGIINYETGELTLEMIEENGLMKELGIYAELKKFWDAICEWKEEA